MARSPEAARRQSEERYHWLRQNSPETIMLYRTRASAKRRGIECSLVLEDILIPSVCPITLKPFSTDKRNTAPSIDRIDNSVGYHGNNIRVISNRANTLKSDISLEMLERLLIYMRQ